MNTNVANAMANARDRTTLDRHVKSLFGHKSVLVVLLKYCVPEFEDLEPGYIMEHCFVGEPIIGKVPVHRDVPLPEGVPEFPPRETCVGSAPPEMDGVDLTELLDGNARVQGMSAEDVTQSEGTTIYDIVFQVRVPDTESVISLLINVEIQNDGSIGYEVATRGIYYCGRLISAQRDRIFRKQEYQKLQKVYSIWICPYSRKGTNAITTYDIRETVVEGDGGIAKKDYDKLETVVITFNAEGAESENKLIRFLGLLLNREMPVEERQRLIEQEYRIAMTDEIVEEVREMCSFSEAIERQGRMEGRREGLAEGRREGEDRFARLMQRLFNLGRYEDAQKATADAEYRAKLYSEFQLA